MRKPFIAGNWKMHKTASEAVELVAGLKAGHNNSNVDVAVIPPFLAIPAVAEELKGSSIQLGAQNVYWEKSGAFTGEVSPGMLKDAGCGLGLVGHSERRHVMGETDEMIRRKLDALLKESLDVILCVGELLEEREAGETEKRLDIQVRAGLQDRSAEHAARVTIAYEPVWAIGTGNVATTEQAQEAHRFIRGLVVELCGQQIADGMRIQYGGSVKPDNAAELLSQPDVDGALVGGAALKADSFLGIIAGAL